MIKKIKKKLTPEEKKAAAAIIKQKRIEKNIEKILNLFSRLRGLIQ